ncbi:cuticle protein 7-like isoform X1 [Penaeus chinensis]|uniref:cuticle protein 7-like isoform X1 n=1 Tax=Penaeus chinensis TaxID=139456 RepID=UPI001FB6B238|nr:cuticle protein 7-like isoform X1 [Penaeus chinensis]
MVSKMFISLLAVMGVALAYPSAPYASHYQPKQPLMPYAFEYGVADYRGNNFNRKEHSDGQKVQGSYSVDLPDGRVQTVNYHADGQHGFVADVQYTGQAHHPPTPVHGSSGSYGSHKY